MVSYSGQAPVYLFFKIKTLLLSYKYDTTSKDRAGNENSCT